MVVFLLVLIILACVLLTLIILVQNPKGGGIASGAFGSQATQFLGARQTADFLEKATWYFGIGILVIVIISYFFTVAPHTTDVAKGKQSKTEGLDLSSTAPRSAAPAAGAPKTTGIQKGPAPIQKGPAPVKP